VQTGRRWLLLASLLAACQPFAGTGPAGHGTATRVIPSAGTTLTSGQLGASSTPTNVASATARHTVGGLLAKPSTPSVTLAGRVLVDASYVVSSGTGSLISNNGSAVLAAGPTRFAGGGLISDKGSGLVANNAGNVIDAEGNGLISEHGSGVISEHGGGLISDKGSGVIAQSATSLTGAKRGYALFEASIASPAQMPKAVYGTQVPAAGMQIGVLSLATRQRLPVGVDSAGNPVFSVYTNLKGGYEIYLPTAEQGNVLIVTNVPATNDLRQHYDLITATGSTASAIVDEDTALVTRYVRAAFVTRLAHLFVDDPNVAICAVISADTYPAPLVAAMTTLVRQIHAAALKAGVHGDAVTDAAVRALATRCADATLARLDLSTFKLEKSTSPYWGEHNPLEVTEPFTEAMVKVMKAVREKSTARLAIDPGFFEKEPYFSTAVACKPGAYSIKKPSDVNAFIVDEFLSENSADAIEWSRVILRSLDVGADESGIAYDRRLSVASNAVAGGFSIAFVTNQNGVQDLVLQLISAFDPAHPLLAGEPKPAIGQAPCPRPYPPNFATPTPGPAGPSANPCANISPKPKAS
jgi:hypothetical protein